MKSTVKLKNLLHQPLTVHLKGQTKSLHLGPRAFTIINEDLVSGEILNLQGKGYVRATKIKDSKESKSKSIKNKSGG